MVSVVISAPAPVSPYLAVDQAGPTESKRNTQFTALSNISATDCGADREETDFAYRLDRWDTYGGNIIHHIAIIDDLELAVAAYEAACKRWPGEAITLRQGARIIKATRV